MKERFSTHNPEREKNNIPLSKKGSNLKQAEKACYFCV
jgi:hypothetical protein